MNNYSNNNTPSKYVLYRIIQEFMLPYRSKFILAIVCMVVVGLTTAIHVKLLKPAIDDIFFRKDPQALVIIPLIIFSIAVIKGIADYIQSYLMKYIGQRIVSDVQVRLFRKVIETDLDEFKQEASGKIISRFTNDILIMRGSVSFLLTSLANRSITILSLILLMFQNSITLSLITFGIFPLTAIPVIMMSKKMRKISDEQQERLGVFTAQLDDSFQAIKVIKSFQSEEFEISKAQKVIEKLFQLYIRAAQVHASSSPIIEILSGIGIGFVLWYGGSAVVEGTMTPGSVFSFIAAFAAAYKPIKAIAALNNSLQEGLIAAKRIFSVLDRKSEKVIKFSSNYLQITSAQIEFKNLNFSYGEKHVLKDLNLVIPASKKIAIVGESGGGKSTIINLLLRFHEYHSGEILIDNQNIQDYSIESLRSNISLVSQEVILFDSNLYDNIAYGRDYTKDEIIQASKLAHSHHFIEKLPHGYDTIIGQNGFTLSGGQRQKISLARAFLRNTKILLLDEATSSLDPISESYIQDGLRNMKDKTIIVVAHRLSSIIDADLIYVISDGRIAEFGTHNDLITKLGIYSSLYNQQKKEDKFEDS
jgi:subfamily B ATP-binding cassette protein MsbA